VGGFRFSLALSLFCEEVAAGARRSMGSGGKRVCAHVIFEDWALGLFWLLAVRFLLLLFVAGARRIVHFGAFRAHARQEGTMTRCGSLCLCTGVGLVMSRTRGREERCWSWHVEKMPQARYSILFVCLWSLMILDDGE
jgi:hypothetical protein